jgi:hypothetical protein
MATPNVSKRFSWMYETTAGTTLFDALNDTTYYFGIYNTNINKWNYPRIENKIGDYHIYNTRNPILVDDGSLLSPFTHTYIPTSAQHLVWQKGKCTDASPDTFAAADYNKEQYAISIRGEQNDGTTDTLMQLNGAFSTKLFGVIQAGSPYTVEQTWNYMNYDDHDDHPNLTTAPSMPDTSSTPYVGLPTVTYDYGGTPYVIPNIIKFDYTDEAIFSQAYTNVNETAQVIYKERFLPTVFTLTGIFEVNTMWDDYIDRVGTKEIRVQIYKADTSEYIIFDLTNIRIQDIKAEGEGFKGYYASVLIGQAASLSGSFTAQGTFATHYKGETT